MGDRVGESGLCEELHVWVVWSAATASQPAEFGGLSPDFGESHFLRQTLCVMTLWLMLAHMRSPHCVLMALDTAACGSAAFLGGFHGPQGPPSPPCPPWTWAEVGKARGERCWLWHLGPNPSHESVTGEKLELVTQSALCR